MDRFAGLVARFTSAPAAAISLVEPDRQVFPGAYGLPMRQTPISQSLCHMVVEHEAPVVITDLDADARTIGHGARGELGIRAYLGAPLHDDRGVAIGSVCAISFEPVEWTDDDLATVTDLAFAVEAEVRARLATVEAAASRDRVRLVADASRQLNSTLDVRESLARMLDVLVPQVAQWCVIYTKPVQDGLMMSVSRHADRGEDERLALAVNRDSAAVLGDPLVAGLLDGSVPYGFATFDPSSFGELRTFQADGGLGDEGTLLVPIGWGEERLGVWILHADPEHGPFSSVDVVLARDLGLRAGNALRNSQQFERERTIAVELQRRLLPSLAEVPGLEVCGAYLPASLGAAVGGDWYDLIVREDGCVAVTVGDVTGHTITAGAAMGRVTGAIRCYAHDGLEPDELITKLDGLSRFLLEDLYATCVCATLQPRERGWRVQLCNAGHLPPLVVAPDGTSSLLRSPPGPPLGVPPRDERAPAMAELPFGSMLVLYSDGLVERRREPLDVGLDRLRAACEQLTGDVPVTEICDQILAHTEPEGTDDVALLCIRLGQPAT